MRYVRIFLLHFQDILEKRAWSFVWFLLAFLNPLLIFLFWYGAFKGQNALPSDWSLSAIASYYFLLIIATSLLTAHIEEDVARVDIQEGQLSKYLVKPFSYYWMKFFMELPHRLFQGFLGIIVFIFFLFFFGRFLNFTTDSMTLLLGFIILTLAFFLSFTFKMLVGIIAFWLIDVGGFFQLVDLTMLIFSGYIIPLELLPEFWKNLSFVMPFSFMIYFPVTTFQGKYEYLTLIKIILAQVLWLSMFSIIYIKLWNKGIKKYTAVGQ